MSILEKFRKRLFVGTVLPKKKKEKGDKVSIHEKFRKKKRQIFTKLRKRLFVGTVPPKKRRKSVEYLKI